VWYVIPRSRPRSILETASCETPERAADRAEAEIVHRGHYRRQRSFFRYPAIYGGSPAVDISGWAAQPEALAAFLDEPNLCRVATIDENGLPHVVPAWHWWDGTSFWVGAQARDRKIEHIRRSGTAGIEVDGDIRRKRGIYSTGTARLIEGPDGMREYVRITTEQVRRYQPDRPPHETAERFSRSGTPVVLQVTPDRMISWGR
jgi:nitroimidazol reductase NimA-like FMN-containing flavoprotein (pyridoxamine 5'-phosphate oxidase superfamily)